MARGSQVPGRLLEHWWGGTASPGTHSGQMEYWRPSSTHRPPGCGPGDRRFIDPAWWRLIQAEETSRRGYWFFTLMSLRPHLIIIWHSNIKRQQKSTSCPNFPKERILQALSSWGRQLLKKCRRLRRLFPSLEWWWRPHSLCAHSEQTLGPLACSQNRVRGNMDQLSLKWKL